MVTKNRLDQRTATQRNLLANMVHFFKSSACFFLLATATVTANSPHKPGGLRALRNNNKAPAPKRSLEKKAIFHPNSKNRHADRQLQATAPPSLPCGTFPPFTPAPFTPAPIDPEQCLGATALEVGETVEGTFEAPEGVWYSVVGTGGILAVSTCTGDVSLDGNGVDTVISAFSGDCDALNIEAVDDDGGSCGGLKSTAYIQTVEGETYHMNVTPFGGFVDPTNNAFGLTVFEVDEIPPPITFPPNTFPPSTPAPIDPEQCLEATALEVGETVEGTFEAPEGVWYSVVGTGGILAVSTCTGDASLDGNGVDTVISAFSGDCDALNIEAVDDDGGSCGGLKSTAYIQTVEGETYHMNVTPYGGFVNPCNNNAFGLTVFEVDEIPATPPPFTFPPITPAPIDPEKCLEATALEVYETVEGTFETPEGVWYSVVGTGGTLAVSTCTGDASLDGNGVDTVISVFSGNCDALNIEAVDDDGGSCGGLKSTALIQAVEGEMYHINVTPYGGFVDPSNNAFGLTVFYFDD